MLTSSDQIGLGSPDLFFLSELSPATPDIAVQPVPESWTIGIGAINLLP
jgi:hypothetical protein